MVEVIANRIAERLQGHPSIFDPGLMADRLSRTWGDRQLPPGSRPWIGSVMRWTYGPSWGMLLSLLVGERGQASWPLWGLGLGSAILGLELVTLPLSGATPPLREWGIRQVAEDAANAAAYGFVAAAVCRLLAPEEDPR
ncbi:MAG: hypothetical protein LBJ87_01015 [bacterium]|nr:hypothetical protein [bacterium]